MKRTEHEPFLGVRVIDNAVADCDAMIAWLEAQGRWEQSPLYAAGSDFTRTSDSMSVAFLSYTLPPVWEAANRVVWQEIDRYGNDFAQGFYTVENVSVQRYKVGQRYDVHKDNAAGSDRVISAVLYLNDVEGGGETRFPRLGIDVTPRAGRLALFPSFFIYEHGAMPPTKGVKYAAAYWARG
jgi:hypothetical protein